MADGRLTAYLDEHLDDPDAADVASGIPDPVLAEIGAARSGAMREIVATIQAEQDHIIRGPLEGALIVQGGPGTGKTAVGLHRAAYLLFEHRRVLAREGVNARALSAEDVPYAVGLVTIDVSFISLRLILPALLPYLEPGADIVALVKPQFEAGRGEVGAGGIVSDPAVQDAAIRRITEAAEAIGLVRVAMIPAVITGATGNQEFFLHLRRQT